MALALLVLLVMPVAFGGLLWSSLRRQASRAGWFTVTHHAAPILGLLLMMGVGEATGAKGESGALGDLGVALGCGVCGAMLVWLLRKAGATRR